MQTAADNTVPPLKHTPGRLSLPWHVHLVDNTAVIDASGDDVASMCGDYEVEETGLLMEERAAFIIRAANSHHAMKEALEKIAGGWVGDDFPEEGEDERFIVALQDVARAALSRLDSKGI